MPHVPTNVSPFPTPSSVLVPRVTHPGRIPRLILLALAFLAGSARASAALYQNISVNVMSRELVRVERREYPVSETTQAVAAQVRGPNRIHVKIFVFIGTDDAFLEQIKDYCRKAGATSFFIVRKA